MMDLRYRRVARSIHGFPPALAVVWTAALCATIHPTTVHAATAAAPSQGAPATPTSLVFPDWDEPVIPLTPRRSASAQQRDRVSAGIHFARAQLNLRRGSPANAWRPLARAHRLHPTSTSILLSLIRAAFDAQRPEIAIRYALRYPHAKPIDAVLWHQLATYAMDQARWPEAIRLLEQNIACLPADASRAQGTASAQPTSARVVLLQYQVGRLYALSGQPAQAAAAFQHVIAALDHPADYGIDDQLRDVLVGPPGSWSFMAESFLAARDFATAEQLFRREAQRPRREDLLPFFQAQLAEAQGQHGTALKLIQDSVQAGTTIWGEAPYLMYWRLTKPTGESAKASPDRDSVRVTLEAVVAQQPEMKELAQRLADEYRELGESLAAERMLHRAQNWPELTQSFVQRQAWPELADLLARVARDYGNLEMLRGSLQLVADSPALLSPIRAELLQQSTWNAALAAAWLSTFPAAGTVEVDLPNFVQAYGTAPGDNDTRGVNWSLDLLVLGFDVPALRLLDHVDQHCRTAAQRPFIGYYRSLALEALGRMPESRIAAHTAWQLAPDQSEFQAHWAWCLLRDGYPSLALPAYTSTVAWHEGRVPTEPDIRDQLRTARMTMANLELVRQNIPAAEEYLEQVLDEFPDDLGALNDLAFIWADQRQHLHRALPMAIQAAEADPLNPAYRDTLGWTLFRLSRYEEAILQLRRAVELMENPDGAIVEHLGDALHAAGKQDEAVVAWQQATERLAHIPEAVQRIRQKISVNTDATLTAAPHQVQPNPDSSIPQPLP